MPIFISYSHQDKEFVDKLAFQLVAHNINVWVDRWELSLGDSIIEKVQDAIEGSSAILVILSKRSVESEWCKKEINAGLLKELEKKKVFVLPVLIDDCELPIFVRGKMYADFRSKYDEGLKVILEGIAKITNPHQNRESGEDYFTDWSLDWGELEDNYVITLSYIQSAKSQPYSCLTIVDILSSDVGTQKCIAITNQESRAHANKYIIGIVSGYLNTIPNIRIILSDSKARTEPIAVEGPDSDESYLIHILSRRMGQDTGRNVSINVSSLIEQTQLHIDEVLGIKKV